MKIDIRKPHKALLIALIIAGMAITTYFWVYKFYSGNREAVSTDAMLMNLIERRDSSRIIEMLENETITYHYKYNGEASLITVASYAKMPDLFRYLLKNKLDDVDPQLLAGVFHRNDNYPQESAQIVFEYIRRNNYQDRINLDFYDSLFLLLRMCYASPFSVEEVTYILDGASFSVEHDIHQEVLELSQNDELNAERILCLKAVVERVSPRPADEE